MDGLDARLDDLPLGPPDLAHRLDRDERRCTSSASANPVAGDRPQVARTRRSASSQYWPSTWGICEAIVSAGTRSSISRGTMFWTATPKVPLTITMTSSHIRTAASVEPDGLKWKPPWSTSKGSVSSPSQMWAVIQTLVRPSRHPLHSDLRGQSSISKRMIAPPRTP